MRNGRVASLGTPEEVFYADPAPRMSPATVRVVSPLRKSHPKLGKPVSFAETLAVLKTVLGE